MTAHVDRDAIRAADAVEGIARARSGKTCWAVSAALHLALLVLSVVCAGMFDRPAAWACAVLAYGFASVQIGFLGHDLEHGQVPLSRRWRDRLGLLCWNLLLGVSLRWWRQKHRTHHRHTHVDGSDPDLYPLFVYDVEQARRLTGVRRWFVARQAWLFWPIASGARMYFQWLSVAAALRLPRRHRASELAALCAHHALVWAAAWTALGTGAVWFLLAGHIVAGLYMALAFSTNHLGMPLAQGVRSGVEWQVAHTRDIRTHRLGTYLLGGLDLQIEHHLHPSVGRSALRALQPVVESRCLQAGIPYRRVGILTAWAEVQASLHRVAAAARER